MNDVKLYGRVARTPDVKVLNNEKQTKVTRYTLAVNKNFQQDGKPKANFINCVCYGKVADIAQKYLGKGTPVIINGSLETGSYEKNGEKVYTVDVVEKHWFVGSSKKDVGSESSIETEEGTEDDLPI